MTSGSAQPNVAPTTPVAPTDIVERLDRLIRANNFSATTNAELREAAQTIRELREQVAQPHYRASAIQDELDNEREKYALLRSRLQEAEKVIAAAREVNRAFKNMRNDPRFRTMIERIAAYDSTLGGT